MSSQLQTNREEYAKVKDKMEARYLGKVALMHDGEIVAIYNDSGDAYQIGCEKYGLGHFTTQTIGQRPISLGIFTLCVPEQPAQ